MDQVRPYLILGESHRARVADHIRQCMRQWTGEWLARGTLVPTVAQIESASSPRWIVAEADPLHAVGIGRSQSWPEQGAALFTGHASPAVENAGRSELIHSVADSALEELAKLLCDKDCRVHRPDAGPVEQLTASGSGFLAFECRFEIGQEIQIVGWPGWVASFRGDRARREQVPQLVSPANALGSETVRLSAVVGQAELPIGEFAMLSVGDVLVVDHLLEKPLAVRVDGGDVFAGGHLCTSSGQKAIELVLMDA